MALQAVRVKQKEAIAGLQTLYHKADASLKEINVKFRDWSTNRPPGPGREKKKKWFLENSSTPSVAFLAVSDRDSY